jgi:aspartate/methionine/tyrosine aminotransferase
MSFVQFDLERWQSTWENQVRINLAESGVHPLTIRELLEISGSSIEAFADQPLGYDQSDGTPELRETIAGLYPGASPDHITTTVGSSEANFISCWTLVEPGDHVAILTPTYMQTHGLVQNLGASVSEFQLQGDRGWEPDPEHIERAIVPGTKLVIVTNPNNPTGHVLSQEARDQILERTAAVGAWLLADEVYQGAELDGNTTPSFWGAYEQTIIVNGLSKAYGLPGLRIGWTVSPAAFKTELFQRHDYTVIGPSPASDYLARLALANRDKVLARTRRILNTNYPILEAWFQGFGEIFDWQRPDCGAICFARYGKPISALDLAEQVRIEQDILLEPGDHFSLPQHLRMGYGNERSELEDALRVLEVPLARILGS